MSRWLSNNPDKAWVEKFFLAYSPVWMAVMGAVMALGIDERLGDVGFVVLGLAVAAPLWIVPAIASHRGRHPDRPRPRRRRPRQHHRGGHRPPRGHRGATMMGSADGTRRTDG